MQVLIIADQVAPALYEHYNPELFSEVDLVISCGDLPCDYLEFVISTLNVPCFFVPGNHDTSDCHQAPPGWILLDGKVIEHNGISLMGLGGSMRYKPGVHQYTEEEMRRRLLLMKPSIWWRNNRIDILVTHAPAYQLGDMDTRTHRGFKVFREVVEQYSPRFFVHGHVHLNYTNHPRELVHNNTRIINGYQYHLFEIDP